MDRKTFIHVLASIPLLNIPFRTAARSRDGEKCKTQNDAEGPFYKANAPLRSVIETKGQPLVIEGRVLQSGDCETPVANAVLDIWHCNDEGEYDLKGFNGRGQVKTDKNGRYSFTTIYPPPYGNRPRHIHFKIRSQGRQELTTQLYFQGDPNIKNDFARDAEPNRVISLRSEENLKKGVFDIYL
jgi:protocatechuate 3,4-dioxygenase beta subunit